MRKKQPKPLAPLARHNLGFLLAKASQRWNDNLQRHFAEAGFAQIRPAYGAILLPLFSEDGLRIGELASRSGLSKQTLTTMVRDMEKRGLVSRRPDSRDRRATRIMLSRKARQFEAVAAPILARMEQTARRKSPGATTADLKTWLAALCEPVS